MLPNLSSLSFRIENVDTISVKVQKPKIPGFVDPGNQSRGVHKRRISDSKRKTQAALDLPALLTRDGKFRVHVPRLGQEDWQATFTVEQGTPLTMRMYTTGEPAPLQEDEDDDDEDIDYCAELEYRADLLPPTLYVSTLFEVSDRFLATCDMQPMGAPGVGNMTLQVFDVIAVALGVRTISLGDMASYRPEGPRPPITLDNSLSETLSLLRGYGYYEARGYFDSDFADSLEGDRTGAPPIEVELTRIKMIDLSWIHTLTTTPLKNLEGAIAGFPAVVNSFGFQVPEFCQRKYTVEWCAEHAARVRVNTIQPIFDWIKANFDEQSTRSAMDSSMRELCKRMTVGTTVRQQNAFGSALVQPFYVAVGKGDAVMLTKHIFNGKYLSVRTHPDGGDSVPLLEWTDVRQDIRVETGYVSL